MPAASSAAELSVSAGMNQKTEKPNGDFCQINDAQTTPDISADEEQQELAAFDERAAQLAEIPEGNVTWSKHGSGKYRGLYYHFRERGGARRVVKGTSGRLDNPKHELPPRPGKGNHTRGETRRGGKHRTAPLSGRIPDDYKGGAGTRRNDADVQDGVARGAPVHSHSAGGFDNLPEMPELVSG